MSNIEEATLKLKSAFKKLLLLLLSWAFAIAALVIFGTIADKGFEYWKGRFDRDCTERYTKYQTIDTCQSAAKCLLTANELKFEHDFEEECRVDVSYDKSAEKYVTTITAVPKARR